MLTTSYLTQNSVSGVRYPAAAWRRDAVGGWMVNATMEAGVVEAFEM